MPGRLRLTTALALVTIVVVGAIVEATVGRGRAATPSSTAVHIDLRATRQVIEGFGTSERVWSDPHMSNSPTTRVPLSAQRTILDALYRRLGLTRVRPILDPGTQPAPGAKFNFAGKLGEDHIALVKQARAYGLKVFYPGPVYLEDWMRPNDPGAYVNWALNVLRYWRTQGLEPPYYSVLNEPKLAGDFPPSWMHDVVLELGRRLRAEGFRTKLVVPDDENPVSAYERSVAVLRDPEARRYVGALAYHIYNGSESDWARMKALAARYRLPVWMTEFNDSIYHRWPDVLDWAEKLHDLFTVGGVSAVDYYLGFLGSWGASRGTPLIEISFDNGDFRGFALTPAYFVTGQYSRFVRPGYHRVVATPEDGDVQTVAFSGGRRVVVVATNPHGSSVTARFEIVGGKVGARATAVRSSASERLRSLPTVTVRRGVFSATLPPQSVTTFVLHG